MHTQTFTQDDGLSHIQATDYFQDSRGVLWIGTSNGLNSYNGAQFNSYTKNDGLAHNYILNITEDNIGNLWIRTGDFSANKVYYNIYEPETGQFNSLEDYLETSYPFKGGAVTVHDMVNGVNIIEEKHAGAHWLYELKDKKIKFLFKIPYSQKRIPSINWIRKAKNGRYRFVLYNLNNDKIGLGVQYEYDVEKAQLNQMDIKAYQNITWSDFNKEYKQIKNVEKFDRLLDILSTTKFQTGNGLVHQFHDFHIFENQLVVLDKKNLKILHYDLKTCDISKEYYCGKDFTELNFTNSFRDKKRGYWVHGDENITRVHFEQVRFQMVSDNKRNGNFAIRGMVKVGAELCFACYHGICKEIDGQVVYKEFGEHFGVHGSSSTGFALEGDEIWITTEQTGLFNFHSSSEEVSYYPFDDNRTDFLWQPFVDKNAQIWIGGVGLYKLDKAKGTISLYSDGDFAQLNQSTIYSFHETQEGTWLCTNKGMYLVDLDSKTILRQYNKQAKEEHLFLPFDECVHLYRDETNVFWIATKGDGLVKWNPNTGAYKSFTKTNSELTNDIIYAVYEDELNNLWLPSNYGLMKFNKDTEEVNTFYKKDGLPNNEFNTTSHFQDKDGILYFGTLDGVVHFDPLEFDDKTTQNPILLTNASRMNNELETENILTDLKENKSVIISPQDRFAELEFALVNFNKKAPDKYSYRIKGFQEDWTYSDIGLVRLQGLPYGTYSIEVRGKSADATKWSTYENDISIVVKKPFYLQWWFLLGAIIFFSLFIFALVRWNTNKFIQRQKELEQVVLERTEEIRLQAEELEVMDKVKNNFFANISHELRTPLTLILGPLSYIIDNPEKLDDIDVQKQLIVMQRNGTNLLHLIEEILDLSKLEAKKMELKEVATDVKAFFDYMFNVFEPQFETMGIQANLKNNLEPNFHVLMDRNKMEKVLNNFLSNAIKHTSRGGSISLSLERKDDILIITVEDSGVGIHESDMPHIFDRFFQSKQGDNKLRGGTGIGLALVQEFASLMKAKVCATSEIGKGSVFTFELPIKQTNGLSTAIDPSVEEEPFFEDDLILKNKEFTILVAEDNPDMREFICDLLGKTYKTVISANNGAEAWKILKEKQTEIHLVVSDVMMPEVDGLELVKKAKADKNLSTIPFVMLTALAAERDKLAALTIGVDDYLTKPFSVPELLARINNMLINASMRKAWWSAFKKEELPEQTSKTESNAINEHIQKEDMHLSAKDKEFLEELKQYVESNPSQEALDLEALSKKFLLSVRHLNRKIKSITGLPPGKFVREVQLQKARRLIEDNNLISISEVAYSVGFHQPSTFSALFKKRFGVVPSKYLKGTKQRLE